MKIYLASRYSMRDRLREHRSYLELLGHKVTSRWLDTEWEPNDEGPSAAPSEFRREYAEKDFDDVQDSHMLIYFATGTKSRGGCHVEFGIAFGLLMSKTDLIDVCVIGEPENIFHFHPAVQCFPSWEKFTKWLEGEE